MVYHEQVRMLAVRAVLASGETVLAYNSACCTFGMAERTLRYWVAAFQATGSVSRKKRGRKLNPVFNRDHIGVLLDIVTDYADLYLDEIAVAFRRS